MTNNKPIGGIVKKHRKQMFKPFYVAAVAALTLGVPSLPVCAQTAPTATPQ